MIFKLKFVLQVEICFFQVETVLQLLQVEIHFTSKHMFYWITWSILRVSPLGTPTTQTAEIARRLKAAEPTIVPGPSSPDSKLFPTISMIESKISGAEEPCSQFHRYFTSSFCADILSTKKITKPNCKYRKAAQSTFVQKAARKMFVKLIPGPSRSGWQQFRSKRGSQSPRGCPFCHYRL